MILDEFEASGMSGMAFAAHVGVKYRTFAVWVKQRHMKAGGVAPLESSRLAGSCCWVEVVPGNLATQSAAPLVVLLPDGPHGVA